MAIELDEETLKKTEEAVQGKTDEGSQKQTSSEPPDVEKLLSELVEGTPELKPPSGKEKWFDRFSTYEEAEQAYKKLQAEVDGLKKAQAELTESSKKLDEYKPILDALERNPDIVKVLLDRAAGINTPIPSAGDSETEEELDFVTEPEKAIEKLLSKKLSGIQQLIAQAVDKAVNERLQKLSEAQSVLQTFRSNHPEVGDQQLMEIARYAQSNNLSLEDAYTHLQEMAKKVLEGWGLSPVKKTAGSPAPSGGKEVNLSKLSQALASEDKDNILSSFADMLLGTK